MSGKIARALANIWNSAAAISNNNSLCWPSKWDPSRRSRSTFRAKSPEDFIQTSSLLRIHVSCEDEGDFHLHLNAVKFTGISLHDFTTYDKQSSIMAIKMAICRHPRKNNFQPEDFTDNARWHFQSCWYLDYVSFNVHATHNNLVKSRSSFFFFFLTFADCEVSKAGLMNAMIKLCVIMYYRYMNREERSFRYRVLFSCLVTWLFS